MYVFTIDKNNNLGHPTNNCKMIRTLLKQKKIKIVKRIGKTILVKFLYKEFDKSKTINSTEENQLVIGNSTVNVSRTMTDDEFNILKTTLLELKLYNER
jgi:hypothetical protein